MDSFELLI